MSVPRNGERERKNQPEVAIIILNWNNYDDTATCLDSIANLHYQNYRVILVDNGSTDGSNKRLKEEYAGRGYTFLENNRNLGFAHGNNRGIELARSDQADYVLLLNNDTVVTSDFLGELVETAEESPEIGIVGPKVLNRSDGQVQSTGFRQSELFPFYKRDGPTDRKWRCDYVHGCSVLISEEVFESIGLLDEDYFLYVEERDFYMRAKLAGFDIVMNPDAIIYHEGMGSTSGTLTEIAAYWKVRNLFRCWRKNLPPYFLLTFVPYMTIFTIYHLRLYELPKERYQSIIQAILKAWVAGLTGLDYDSEFKP